MASFIPIKTLIATLLALSTVLGGFGIWLEHQNRIIAEQEAYHARFEKDFRRQAAIQIETARKQHWDRDLKTFKQP